MTADQAGVFVQRNVGHPWDGRPGFDLMFINVGTEADLDRAAKVAEAKFWQPWLIGTNSETNQPGGVFYKPCDADAPWHDSLDQPHPGHVRASPQDPHKEEAHG